ncbi:nickel pincer cofactor biosynthesis protein LarC [Desulfocucumis palustris]|nr:nickel pincer cofactor biosynthesis protein LarC [Desulfocucumis palustris]
MKILFFDCFAGLSEAALMAALLDAGIDSLYVVGSMNSLMPEKVRIETEKKHNLGLRGTLLKVICKEAINFKSLSEPEHIVLKSGLPDMVKTNVLKVLKKMKEAENRVYGLPPGERGFIESFSAESLVFVAGITLALHSMQTPEVYCSPLPLGSGMAIKGNNLLPVPTPLTAELLLNVPVKLLNTGEELVTPAGAALAVAAVRGFGAAPEMKVKSAGYGIGAEGTVIGTLRVLLGEAERSCAFMESVTVIETNIDDMNPQFYEHIFHLLLKAGVLDVFITPVQMKKNRPGGLLTVLCRDEQLKTAADIILKETTTLGIRVREEKRVVLHRDFITVDTVYGAVKIKVARGGEPAAVLHWTPEYEDCKLLAEQSGAPLQKIYTEVYKLASRDPRLGNL